MIEDFKLKPINKKNQWFFDFFTKEDKLIGYGMPIPAIIKHLSSSYSEDQIDQFLVNYSPEWKELLIKNK
ncbi:MAG: hypothetical protein Nk1A_9120 [Endomicrobiia bacterium]|nr:MAG: hypothetical protein Nk1A_9120 [Endomicrobiia bacterium]